MVYRLDISRCYEQEEEEQEEQEEQEEDTGRFIGMLNIRMSRTPTRVPRNVHEVSPGVRDVLAWIC